MTIPSAGTGDTPFLCNFQQSSIAIARRETEPVENIDSALTQKPVKRVMPDVSERPHEHAQRRLRYLR